jgi:hypothetical protein
MTREEARAGTLADHCGWRTDAPTDGETTANGKENLMLWMIAAVLVYLWLLGLVSSYTIGGFIHLLVMLAVVIVLVKIIQGLAWCKKPLVCRIEPTRPGVP